MDTGKNDATDADIGARLKEAREAAGLTQSQAAKILSIQQSSLALIEKGGRSLKATELVRFSDVYEVSTDWILGEWTEADVPDEWVDLIQKHDPPNRRKLLRVISMMGGRANE